MFPAQHQALRRYKKRRPDIPRAMWPAITEAALLHEESGPGTYPRRNDKLTTVRGFTHALQQAADAILKETQA